MKHIKSTVILLLVMVTSMAGCKSNTKSPKEDIPLFTPPEVPALITSAEGKRDFILEHYWDHFNFADTTILSNTKETEQILANFIAGIIETSDNVRQQAIHSMFDKAMAQDSATFALFYELTEKYLHDPNSPYRNEDSFIVALQYITKSDKIGETEKIRPQYLLDMALKNRPGEVANNFTYTLVSGKSAPMHSIKADYLILFFNNPDCPSCAQAKKYIAGSPIFNRFFYNHKPGEPTLAILAMYVDEEVERWRDEFYPEKWINGYDATHQISENDLYDLKASPTIYLLDKDKKVILKDIWIDEVEQWLRTNVLN